MTIAQLGNDATAQKAQLGQKLLNTGNNAGKEKIDFAESIFTKAKETANAKLELTGKISDAANEVSNKKGEIFSTKGSEDKVTTGKNIFESAKNLLTELLLGKQEGIKNKFETTNDSSTKQIDFMDYEICDY